MRVAPLGLAKEAIENSNTKVAFARLAQLVEQLTLNPQEGISVTSSESSHSIVRK